MATRGKTWACSGRETDNEVGASSLGNPLCFVTGDEMTLVCVKLGRSVSLSGREDEISVVETVSEGLTASNWRGASVSGARAHPEV